jgi:phosphatidylglycerophosphate synthase
MLNAPFAGDQKKGEWILLKAERRMVNWFVPHVPAFIETYHLTLLTLLWSIGAIVSGFLARQNIHWLWLVSLFVLLQYLTDVLDGAVGRYRKTGLVKWGYYMDHLLDYLFLASIIAGYALAFPSIPWYWFLALLILSGALATNVYLSFAATNEFRISMLKIGPTEARIAFLLVNAAIIVFGTALVAVLLPVVVGILTVGLAWVVLRTQKHIWTIDMEQKRRSGQQTAGSSAVRRS